MTMCRFLINSYWLYIYNVYQKYYLLLCVNELKYYKTSTLQVFAINKSISLQKFSDCLVVTHTLKKKFWSH